MEEFKPKVETIRIVLSKEMENMERQMRLAQNLVSNNAAIYRRVASQKLKELKEAITKAKEESKYASTEVKTCIYKQEHENQKAFSVSPLQCSIDYSGMTDVKNKLFKIHTIAGHIMTNCEKLHMDDTAREVALLRKCLTERTDDSFRHIPRIREEMDYAFGKIMQNSGQCAIEGSFNAFRCYGEVMNSLKACKNTVGYTMKKLP